MNTVFQENTRDEEQKEKKKKKGKQEKREKGGVKNKGKRVFQHLSMLVKGLCVWPSKNVTGKHLRKNHLRKKRFNFLSTFKDGDRDLSFKVNDFLET